MSPVVKRAFEKWINHSTWSTGHSLDEERFYRFVWTVLRYSRKRVSEKELRELIVSRHTGQIAQDYLEDKARRYAGLYITLCEFANARQYSGI